MFAIVYVLVLMVPVIALYRLLLTRRVGDEPHCRPCGYNLEASAGPCVRNVGVISKRMG
jgi:hypothetical protein